MAQTQQSDIETLQDLQGGFAVTRCMEAIAEFGVADALGDAPATPEEIARKTGLNADALGRVLRFIATKGIFEDLGGRYGHTALSRLLREDHPQSQKANMRMAKPAWIMFGALDHSLRTGRPSVETLNPSGLWAWLQDNPDMAKLFDQGMASKSLVDIASLLAAYDFSSFRSITDIGGGRGHLLRAVLERAPHAQGFLFDQPSVIEQVRGHQPSRMSLIGGDFFTDALPASDAYLLMNVIHDWEMPQATKLLSNIRKAAPADARLLMIEIPLPETPQPHYVNLLDLYMLTWTGARERKRSEYEALLAAGGWQVERVIVSSSGIAIFESVKSAN